MTLLDTRTERSTLLRRALEQLTFAAPSEEGRPATPVSLAYLDDEERAYVSALHDVLRLLGALAPVGEGEGASVPSVQGGYLARMLISLLDGGAPLVARWDREGLSRKAAHPFGSAVDLLAALELRRLELQPDARPLRQNSAAVGVIARGGAAGPEYLVVWDADARAWQLAGGRTELRDRSPRDTLLRELSEELACPPLREGVHVSLGDLGTYLGRERLSPTYGLLTRTTFHLFAVRFLVELPSLHRDARWVTEFELLAGTTHDGQTIAAEPLLLLRERLGEDVVELLVG